MLSVGRTWGIVTAVDATHWLRVWLARVWKGCGLSPWAPCPGLCRALLEHPKAKLAFASSAVLQKGREHPSCIRPICLPTGGPWSTALNKFPQPQQFSPTQISRQQARVLWLALAIYKRPKMPASGWLHPKDMPLVFWCAHKQHLKGITQRTKIISDGFGGVASDPRVPSTMGTSSQTLQANWIVESHEQAQSEHASTLLCLLFALLEGLLLKSFLNRNLLMQKMPTDPCSDKNLEAFKTSRAGRRWEVFPCTAMERFPMGFRASWSVMLLPLYRSDAEQACCLCLPSATAPFSSAVPICNKVWRLISRGKSATLSAILLHWPLLAFSWYIDLQRSVILNKYQKVVVFKSLLHDH